MGDPDLGYGLKQPGAWTYNILAYCEETALRELGKGGTAAEKNAAGQKLIQTPLPFLNCPSRREPILYPVRPEIEKGSYSNGAISRDGIKLVAKSCYAKNGGNEWYGYVGGPNNLAGAKTYAWPPMSKSTGVDWWYMTFKPAMIKDGTSQTFMFGEKHINFRLYDSWQAGGDASNMYEAMDIEVTRTMPASSTPLTPDSIKEVDQMAEDNDIYCFGGPHRGIIQFAFCDGSVKSIEQNLIWKHFVAWQIAQDGESVNDGTY